MWRHQCMEQLTDDPKTIKPPKLAGHIPEAFSFDRTDLWISYIRFSDEKIFM